MHLGLVGTVLASWGGKQAPVLVQQLICSQWDCTLGVLCGSRPLSHGVDVSGWPLGFVFG